MTHRCENSWSAKGHSLMAVRSQTVPKRISGSPSSRLGEAVKRTEPGLREKLLSFFYRSKTDERDKLSAWEYDIRFNELFSAGINTRTIVAKLFRRGI